MAKPNSPPCQCLWQRCNRSFVRSHPAQVFCGEECRKSAIQSDREQRTRKADREAKRRYRSSERGRAKHREYCRASRQRKKDARSIDCAQTIQSSCDAREGDTNRSKSRIGQKSSCQRPGCGADWRNDPRAPHKKFCSSLCDNALRAAVARVTRYYKALGYVGAITSSNRMQVLLARPGSRVQLRAFERVILRC